MHSVIIILGIGAVALADLPAVYEKPVVVKYKEGDTLTLKVPSATNIWHRKFSDGQDDQYVEACNPYLDVCQKWRYGELGSKTSPAKVEIKKDGTLVMPKVTAKDSAQYYTYYFHTDGVHHYSYFNVTVTKA